MTLSGLFFKLVEASWSRRGLLNTPSSELELKQERLYKILILSPEVKNNEMFFMVMKKVAGN